VPLFANASIRTRLLLSSVLSNGTALLIIGVLITGLDLVSLRQRLVGRMAVQADIVGANCLSALLFSDPKSAETTLSALKADARVRAAALYSADRRLFATYLRDPEEVAGLPPEAPTGAAPGFHRAEDRLVLSRDVLFDGKTTGTVVLVSDLSDIRQAMTRDLSIFAGVLLGSLLLAIAVSMWLQRAIERPLLGLAEAARRVGQEKDYTARAEGGGRDEIGTVIGTFNEMIGEIQKQETELRAARDRLEQRVAERTAQLANANKELEAFSYSVSHDLRAPLRSIEGFSRALMEDCGEDLSEAGTDSLNRIVASTVRMAQLIDGLLNLSRLTRTELRGGTVDLSALAGEILTELREGEDGRPVDAVVAPGVVAHGDPALLRAVLQNLMANAWKFTRKKERPRIEFGVDRAPSGTTYFVQDNGAGFDMAYSDKLFGAFQRLHGQTEFPGIGIGLATVQRIVSRHGGRVWAVAAPDKGATIYFTLGNGGRNGG